MKKALTATLFAAALYSGCSNTQYVPVTESQAPQVSAPVPQTSPLEERVAPSSALSKYPKTYTINGMPAAEFPIIVGDNADIYTNVKEDVISGVDLADALRAKKSVVDYEIGNEKPNK